jgi:hypothetical protein
MKSKTKSTGEPKYERLVDVLDVTDYGNNGSGYSGYIQPLVPGGGSWIMYVLPDGTCELYMEREPSGAVVGAPIILKPRSTKRKRRAA